MQLEPELVKVVCSENQHEKRKRTNQEKLGKKYIIEKPLDPVKKVNFYTSTCFEGCDIFDEEGRTYIVSDGNSRTTLLDVSTLLIQICGRIRNSIYKDEIVHIFSRTRYSGDILLEDYIVKQEEEFLKSQEYVKYINLLDKDGRRKTVEAGDAKYWNSQYIQTDNEYNLSIDRNLLNLDIVNFKIATGVYSSRIAFREELKKNRFDIRYSPYTYCSDKLKEDGEKKISFKNAYLEYAELRSSRPTFIASKDERVRLIEEKYDFIYDAHFKLGAEKVKQLSYHVGNIKKELAKISDQPLQGKIKEMVVEQIGLLKKIPCEKAKQTMQSIYDTLGIKKTAKATDLNS